MDVPSLGNGSGHREAACMTIVAIELLSLKRRKFGGSLKHTPDVQRRMEDDPPPIVDLKYETLVPLAPDDLPYGGKVRVVDDGVLVPVTVVRCLVLYTTRLGGMLRRGNRSSRQRTL